MPHVRTHQVATVVPVHPATRVIRTASAWMWMSVGQEVNAELEPNASMWPAVDTLAVAPRAR